MPHSVIDRAAFNSLKEMAGADFIGELIDTFLEDAPRLMKELHDSLAADDAEAFRRAAHSLKSNSASFGASHLSDLARELEGLGRANKLEGVGQRLEVLEKAYKSVAKELKGMPT